jgi:hypothetical protein
MPDNTTMTTDPLTGTASSGINSGDTGWVMICACLVFIMVLYFLYQK